jgi:hypothetical protein
MNRDLFLAILAMDSYNRGYGAGVSKLTPDRAKGRAGWALAHSARAHSPAKTKRCANLSRTKAQRHEDAPPSSF